MSFSRRTHIHFRHSLRRSQVVMIRNKSGVTQHENRVLTRPHGRSPAAKSRNSVKGLAKALSRAFEVPKSELESNSGKPEFRDLRNPSLMSSYRSLPMWGIDPQPMNYLEGPVFRASTSTPRGARWSRGMAPKRSRAAGGFPPVLYVVFIGKDVKQPSRASSQSPRCATTPWQLRGGLAQNHRNLHADGPRCPQSIHLIYLKPLGHTH